MIVRAYQSPPIKIIWDISHIHSKQIGNMIYLRNKTGSFRPPDSVPAPAGIPAGNGTRKI